MTEPNSLKIVERMILAGIPTVIIGGHAVNFHGFARATEDVDLVYLRTTESEKTLVQILADVDAYYIGNEVDPVTQLERIHPVTLEYVRNTHLMMLGTRIGFLDLFDFVPGVPKATVQDLLSTSVQFEGKNFVSLHWLREMKIASDRPQDRIDLQNLPQAK